MLCITADERKLLPYVVFKRKSITSGEAFPKGVIIRLQKKRMDELRSRRELVQDDLGKPSWRYACQEATSSAGQLSRPLDGQGEEGAAQGAQALGRDTGGAHGDAAPARRKR